MPFRSVRRRVALILAWVIPSALVVTVSVTGLAPAANAASAAQVVAASYKMYFYNETYSTPSDGSLTSMSVDGAGNLTGFMTVNPPLFGTGSLTGTVSNGKVHFTVSGGDYTGTVNASTLDLAGTYTYPGQTGQWHATPANQCAISDTGCSTTLVITSPPDNAAVALTDGKYVQPQAKAGQRAPKARHLIVAGTAQCAGPVTVNGVSVTVSGGKWTADVPVGDTGPMAINAQAGGCGQTASSITLVNLDITSPKENQALPITDAPAMPKLDATVGIDGYQSDPSAVTFDWSLTVHGNYVVRKKVNGKSVPDWSHQYADKVAAGSTTGISQSWEPAYSKIEGGIGLLQVTATIPGVLDNPVKSDPRWIDIPGSNPKPAAVNDKVVALDAHDSPTIEHLFCYESGGGGASYPQFNPKANRGQPKFTGVPGDWKPNPPVLQPKFGAPPAGIGIAQIDPAQFPGQDWDWTQNVGRGVSIYKAGLAKAKALSDGEQKRLDNERNAAIALVNKARKAHGLPVIPAPARVIVAAEPSYSGVAGVTADAITRYNTGAGYSLFKFNYQYYVSPNGEQVLHEGNQLWIAQDGRWGTSSGIKTPLKWIDNSSWNPRYVGVIEGCHPPR
jgi:hypothetical protein